MNREISHQTILDYDLDWPSKYKTEAEIITNVLGNKALQIEHIGSTSIPGLCGKPIVDIGVQITSPEMAEECIKLLEEAGYTFDREAHNKYKSAERHFLRKGDPIAFHLSLAYANQGSFWERQILFRDYLRQHVDARDRYCQLKRELLEADLSGKDDYISGKTDFVTDILSKAGFKGQDIN